MQSPSYFLAFAVFRQHGLRLVSVSSDGATVAQIRQAEGLEPLVGLLRSPLTYAQRLGTSSGAGRREPVDAGTRTPAR